VSPRRRPAPDPVLLAAAERELRDALLRFLARIRHKEASLVEIFRAWTSALQGEIDLVAITTVGIAVEGSAKALAERCGFDSTDLGRKGEQEIERMAQMLELVDEPDPSTGPPGPPGPHDNH
jgi:hypothetical protein